MDIDKVSSMEKRQLLISKRTDMQKHKIELTFATTMLIIHLIMVAIYKQIETNISYWIILYILLFGSVVLISRVAWEKFKKNNLN